MTKVLTVLVPVYNTEKYIKRCLDSVLLKEVLNDIEIIAVSDGSKDKSVSIIKEYVDKYPNTLVLVEKENGGHGSTINKGLEIAKGKYFKVLDSDDWVNSIDFIEFVKKLKKEDSDLVVTNYRHEHVYNQSEVYNEYKGLKKDTTYNFNEFDLTILNGEYFVMATSTYKTDILRKTNLHLIEKTFYVDMQYNIEPIINVNTFIYYDLDIYRYYIGRKDQSVNTSSFVRNQDHHEKVMKYLIEYYVNNYKKYSDNKNQYIRMILLYMLYTHYTIYIAYDTNRKNAYEKIKAFDEWFKKTDKSLYDETNKYSIISAHRKTNFRHVKYNKLFRKVYNVLKTIKHS